MTGYTNNQSNDFSKYSASESDIEAHYDVGNDFFRLWLDPEMNYSCALWNNNEIEDTLEKAQKRKLQFHIDASQAKNKQTVLDIGCGWGSLLKALVESNGVKKAVGLTLSQAQVEYIQNHEWDGVEVLLEAWQNHQPNCKYDAIVSLGAFEHFARPTLNAREKIEVYHDFFLKCHDWLHPGGRLSLQTITHGCVNQTKRKQAQKYEKFVFPGSELPRLQEIIIASEDIFKIIQLQNDASNYQKTCETWYQNIRGRKEEAKKIDENHYKRFNMYLKFSSSAFAVGNLALYRILFEKS